ncbi:MAG TPA: caspase family protein, partial [Fimbriimonadaceae bacterium]|nr:caspase family protein [Fimbriimonadaceae bacterium]
MRRALCLFALAFTACLSFGLSPKGQGGQRYALLVGVDEYDQANFIHALGAAGADAEDLGKALAEVGGFPKDNVRILTSHSGNKPTNTNILFELEQLGRNVKPGDTVFFFFSGHGVELGGSTYLLPSNTDARSELTLRQSAIPTAAIQGALSKLPAENLILAFDMCRTDPLKSDRDADPRSDRVSAKQVKDLVLVPSSEGGTGPKQIVTF